MTEKLINDGGFIKQNERTDMSGSLNTFLMDREGKKKMHG